MLSFYNFTMYIVRNFTLWTTAKGAVARGLMSRMNTSCPPWCTAHPQPSTGAHGSDGIAVPCVVRTLAGVEVHHLEVGLVADHDGVWAVIESADRGGPTLTVEVESMRRLVAAWEEVAPA